MAKIKVEIQDDTVESRYPGMGFLGRKHAIEFDEIGTMEEIEEAFLAIAHAAGFRYVARVECVKLASMKEEAHE